MTKNSDKQRLREITLPHRDYQPSKSEIMEEFDMPNANAKTVCSAFFRPFTIRHSELKNG